MGHDPLCLFRPVAVVSGEPAHRCDCVLLAVARSDHAERIATAQEELANTEIPLDRFGWQDGVRDAAALARRVKV